MTKTVVLFIVTFTFSELAFADCVDALKVDASTLEDKKRSLKLDALTSEDKTLLHFIHERDIDALKQFVKLPSVNINVRVGPSNTTPLMIAISSELTDVVEVLVEAMTKEDLNAKDTDGNTALMFAAAVGNISIISILIKAGADKNATNNANKSAHFIALEQIEQSDIENYSDRLKVLDLLGSNGDLGY